VRTGVFQTVWQGVTSRRIKPFMLRQACLEPVKGRTTNGYFKTCFVILLNNYYKENSVAIQSPVLSAALNTISIEEIKKQLGPPPSSCAVVLAEHLSVAFIYQPSGQINDRHCHDYDEWWLVLEGEIDWVIEGREEPVHAKAGDFVFVPAMTFHHIFPTGGKPSIRLGVALPGHGHLHEKPARKAKITIE